MIPVVLLVPLGRNEVIFMPYTFACPLENCEEVMTVEAENDDEALDKLVAKAKVHLAEAHPQLTKTDTDIREDIQPKMRKVE